MKKTDKIDDFFNDAISHNSTEIIPILTSDDEDILLRPNRTVPDELPLLPIRGNVIFPGVMLPITAARKKSLKLIRAAEKNHMLIGIASQRNQSDSPRREDMFDYGCVARVIKVVELPDEAVLVITQGYCRFRLGEIVTDTPHYVVKVASIEEEDSSDFKGTEIRSLIALLRKRFAEVLKANDQPAVAVNSLKNIKSNKLLVNFIAAHANIDTEKKQRLLEVASYRERLEGTIQVMNELMDAVAIKREIAQKTQRQMDRQQREYYLNQQMQVIQDELGGSPVEQEISELYDLANRKNWTEATREAFEKSITKLRRTPPTMPDYAVEVNHLHLMLELPWLECTEDNLDIVHARKVLDKAHFGLDEIKDRIIEHISVMKLKKDMKSPILCLVGPPGTGKTSLGKSIAEAMGRQYVRVALGGLHDESEIRGHRRTYVGAMPGRIIKGLKKAQSSNPVFILDEIDKVQTNSFNGDPMAALLEVLDPEQNIAFHDNYLDLDYDLSKVMFIATANSLSSIDPALLDRMEVISLSGYVMEEKLQIASKYLVPREMKEAGLKAKELKFSKALLTDIIGNYTREAGVRQLDKTIAKVIRRKAVKFAAGETVDPNIKSSELKDLLGLPLHQGEKCGKESKVGVVTGLAWTQAGGEILFIEACTSKGKSSLSLTGNLGDVMKESATLAHEYIKANIDSLGISQETIEESNIHIHVPEGATPKDGPSAGITMFTAMVSAYTRRKVKSHFAMTGEITLRGAVTPVGGIKEKILAAKRADITDIVLCNDNRRDVEEINPEYIKGLTFHYISQMHEVLPLALED